MPFGIPDHPDHLVAYQDFIDQAGAKRRSRAHLIASARGSALLNLVAMVEPGRLTVFDEDPTRLRLFSLLRRLLVTTPSADAWLQRLRTGDYTVEDDVEEALRTDIAATFRDSGDGTSSFDAERHWSVALARYPTLQAQLAESELDLRAEGATDPSFKAWLSRRKNAWVHFGPVHQEVRADSFEFRHPANTVLFFSNPRKVDDRAVLDLEPFRERAPLGIHCKSVRRISNPIWYRHSDDTRGLSVRVSPHPMDRFWYLDTERATPLYREIAEIIKETPYKSILEVGCRHGRVTEFLDESYSFLGFDIVAPAIRRAREKVARRAPDCDFRFVEADWNDPPDADPEVIIFGGVFHYIRDRLAFFRKYLDRYDPNLVIIADIQATDLSSVGAVHPWSDKRTLYLQIKRRYRVIHTFPIRP